MRAVLEKKTGKIVVTDTTQERGHESLYWIVVVESTGGTFALPAWNGTFPKPSPVGQVRTLLTVIPHDTNPLDEEFKQKLLSLSCIAPYIRYYCSKERYHTSCWVFDIVSQTWLETCYNHQSMQFCFSSVYVRFVQKILDFEREHEMQKNMRSL